MQLAPRAEVGAPYKDEEEPMRRVIFVVALSAIVAAGAVANAQPAQQASSTPGIKRTILQRTDVPVTVQHECVVGAAELSPGVNIGKHTHFGVEVGYVLEGEADLMVDGEPVKHLRPGDSYQIATGKPHDARNTGTRPAKVLATYVVEKGKPLATPVK